MLSRPRCDKYNGLLRPSTCYIRMAALGRPCFKENVWFWLNYPLIHDDVKLKHFSRYWPFVRGIHRSPVNPPHKDKWRGALMSSLICAWTNGWVNNNEAGDLRRYRAHYDVTIMWHMCVYECSTRPRKWICLQDPTGQSGSVLCENFENALRITFWIIRKICRDVREHFLKIWLAICNVILAYHAQSIIEFTKLQSNFYWNLEWLSGVISAP